MLFRVAAAAVVALWLTLALATSPNLITFEEEPGAYSLASSSDSPEIYVDQSDWPGVQRAANDLALDFGRVTGQNGTVKITSGSIKSASGGGIIILGTIGKSKLIQQLTSSGHLDVSETEGQWEAYQTKLISKPFKGVSQALVIAGADKRGSIYGLYDISDQIGVSPWYWWADVAPKHQSSISVRNMAKTQASPSVKYRGFFLNDEQPALNNWVQENYPPGKYGPGFNHKMYSTMFELLLRLKANYMWPASWNSMFCVDDGKMNQETADMYGIVMGTSHTEPMMRATKEQSTFLNGTWAWATNEANVLDFMRFGAERAKPYESLYSMGMRGLGDVASPTLNASDLQSIVQHQQKILSSVYGISNVSSIPQMWCLYKEVGGYFQQGLSVPDDITLLWADDNWMNMERLPLANETGRSGGAGIYFHFDYVGSPRSYKWISTISMQKTWEQTMQAYVREAKTIWILNVGDMKPLELPISHFLDIAYDANAWSAPDSTSAWLSMWNAKQFGAAAAGPTTDVMMRYSMLAGRRKYELVDPTTYSIIDYQEADTVLQEWADMVANATKIYKSLDTSMQPSFFEMVLHPCMAGYTLYQIHVAVAKNSLYSGQWRSSTNSWAQKALSLLDDDESLAQRYHQLLGGKWNHMMDQTHVNYYNYWQQPMRNELPPLAFSQQKEISLAGDFGITCDGNNGSIPGDDQWHTNSGVSLTLPPMDPYGPDRWIDIFQRGTTPFTYNISASPGVTITPASGTLATSGSNTDKRLTVNVDWDKWPMGSSMATINISTSTASGKYIGSGYPYGNYPEPQIMVPINKTAAPKSFKGFVESDSTISMEAEHFSSNTSSTAAAGGAYLAIIPGYGRTLSGVTLLPFLAPSQPATTASPHLVYTVHTFTPTSQANITVYMGAALNTNPERPLRYAISVDAQKPQVIQPIPTTILGEYPELWTDMVSNAVATNTTTHDLSKAGSHSVKLWILEPGLTVQKVVVDLGGVRPSYLGPPESMRV